MGQIIKCNFSKDNNIFCKLEEKNNSENRIINIDDFIEEMESSYTSSNNKSIFGDSEMDYYNNRSTTQGFLEFDYTTNYNVKSLLQIVDYYELKKSNMRKDEIIQMLILFETEPINYEIVSRRKYLWNCMNELKKDKFFNRYILF
jgi:hypothetical protein